MSSRRRVVATRPTPRGKRLLVILDGLGDVSCTALGGKTPLEAAVTPAMDSLVAAGRCGLVDPLAPGVAVDTQTGTAILFGVLPDDVDRVARGPVEAAGVGLDMRAGDVALRCNFATFSEGGDSPEILDRRAGRIREDTQRLADVLNDLPSFEGISATFAPASQHRCVLRLSGADLSAAITDTDPGTGARSRGRQDCRPLQAGDPAAERTARAVNELLRRADGVLRAHEVNVQRAQQGLPPANGLLTRGAGMLESVSSVVRDRGLSGAVVAAESTVLGLAALLGFKRVVEPGFTAMPDTDVHAKIGAAVNALEAHDVVWVHFKGTDTTAHDRDPEGKRRFLERIDEALAPLRSIPDLRIGISADHTTESTTGCHTAAPVPSLLMGLHEPADTCTTFSERACARGGLGRLSAAAFVSLWLGGLGLPSPRTETPPEARTSPRSRG